MTTERSKRFIVLSKPPITVIDNKTCISVEKTLKDNHIINDGEMVYMDEENKEYYKIRFDSKLNRFFASNLNLSPSDYKLYLSRNNFELLRKRITSNKPKEYLAIAAEYLESSSTSGNMSDMLSIDLSIGEIKEAKIALKKHIDEQINHFLKEDVFMDMLRNLFNSKTIQEREVFKNKIDDFLKNEHQFTSAEVNYFYREIDNNRRNHSRF